MLSYLNDPTLKARLLEEIGKHEAADAIAQGAYAVVAKTPYGFKFCAIGCALHSLCTIAGHPEVTDVARVQDHSRYPTELGIPIELAYLEDHIFENLSAAAAQTWPRRFAEAVPIGVDLAGVLPQLLQWSILDPTFGWVVFAKTDNQKATVGKWAAAVAEEWSTHGPIAESRWRTLDDELDAALPEWARAWAWAETWAEAWAWAGAWARAWARAGAWAEREYYAALAEETLRLLRAAGN